MLKLFGKFTIEEITNITIPIRIMKNCVTIAAEKKVSITSYNDLSLTFLLYFNFKSVNNLELEVAITEMLAILKPANMDINVSD
ncbi:hypothetical protein P9848_01690 [Geobacillus stearothermophilus]|uniref:hypothetical protein n=1 Tax=Geobacillus stearothermophilus TaxID=1422 RepID=UPI002E231226|nr:hypothetical protein [Geobacillus stearothermophilus]